MLVDERDRFLQGVDHADRYDEVAVLRVPVLLGGRFRLYDLHSAGVPAHLHALLSEEFGHLRQERLRNGGVHQERLHGVAYGGVLGLGVQDHPASHVYVCRRIHVDVTYPGRVPQDRDLRVALDVPDELVGPPGDQEVDVLVEAEDPVDVVPRFHQNERVRRYPRGCGRIPQDPEQGADGFGCLAATFERHPVPRFQAQGHDLRDDVGTGLEYHAQHPDGAADLIQRQMVVEVEFGHHLADGVLQVHDVADARDHPVYLRVVYGEPLEHRFGDLARLDELLPVPEVDGVGLQDLRPSGVEGLRHRFQSIVLDGGAQCG